MRKYVQFVIEVLRYLLCETWDIFKEIVQKMFPILQPMQHYFDEIELQMGISISVCTSYLFDPVQSDIISEYLGHIFNTI